MLPSILAAQGDVVELCFGDASPVAAEYVLSQKNKATSTGERYILAANTVFRPSFFSRPLSSSIQTEVEQNKGRFRFRLLAMPLEQSLHSALSPSRPTTTLVNQLIRLHDLIYRKIIRATLALSILLLLIQFFLTPEKQIIWFSVLLDLLYVLFPFIPCSIIIQLLGIRLFGAARILALFEQLSQSTTPFDDADEVDEFDEEAPPPTKQVRVTAGKHCFNYFASGSSFIMPVVWHSGMLL